MTKRTFTFDPGKYAVVRVEDPEMLAALRADAIAYYKPVNSQERGFWKWYLLNRWVH